MPMFKVLEYKNSFPKTSFLKYCIDGPNDIIGYHESKSNFNFKSYINAGGTRKVKITVLLKYLSDFWRVPEMLLTNCEINILLTWSSICVTDNTTVVVTFVILSPKIHVQVVT